MQIDNHHFYTNLADFQNINLGCTFQMLLARKRGLAHSYFLYENEITSALPFNVFSPRGPIFPTGLFF